MMIMWKEKKRKEQTVYNLVCRSVIFTNTFSAKNDDDEEEEDETNFRVARFLVWFRFITAFSRLKFKQSGKLM